MRKLHRTISIMPLIAMVLTGTATTSVALADTASRPINKTALAAVPATDNIAATATPATKGPVKLSDEQMDTITAGYTSSYIFRYSSTSTRSISINVACTSSVCSNTTTIP
jgi:hypothetical protein